MEAKGKLGIIGQAQKLRFKPWIAAAFIAIFAFAAQGVFAEEGGVDFAVNDFDGGGLDFGGYAGNDFVGGGFDAGSNYSNTGFDNFGAGFNNYDNSNFFIGDPNTNNYTGSSGIDFIDNFQPVVPQPQTFNPAPTYTAPAPAPAPAPTNTWLDWQPNFSSAPIAQTNSNIVNILPQTFSLDQSQVYNSPASLPKSIDYTTSDNIKVSQRDDQVQITVNLPKVDITNLGRLEQDRVITDAQLGAGVAFDDILGGNKNLAMPDTIIINTADKSYETYSMPGPTGDIKDVIIKTSDLPSQQGNSNWLDWQPNFSSADNSGIYAPNDNWTGAANNFDVTSPVTTQPATQLAETNLSYDYPGMAGIVESVAVIERTIPDFSTLERSETITIDVDTAYQRELFGNRDLEATTAELRRDNSDNIKVRLLDAQGNQLGKEGYLDIKQTGNHYFKVNIHGDLDMHFDSDELRNSIAGNLGAAELRDNKLIYDDRPDLYLDAGMQGGKMTIRENASLLEKQYELDSFSRSALQSSYYHMSRDLEKQNWPFLNQILNINPAGSIKPRQIYTNGLGATDMPGLYPSEKPWKPIEEESISK